VLGGIAASSDGEIVVVCAGGEFENGGSFTVVWNASTGRRLHAFTNAPVERGLVQMFRGGRPPCSVAVGPGLTPGWRVK